MIDPRILDALDIPHEADDAEVGRCFRRLMGLAPEESPNPELWVRLLGEIDATLRFPGGDDGDRAQLANNVVMGAVASPGDPDEQRFGIEAWDRELGVGFTESDTPMWDLVGGKVAPRLASAGLYRLH
ncbi:MAG TPA: hypothetical protein VF250_01820 [Conexibacter sp.]